METGLTETGDPAKLPGIHRYVVPGTELTTSNDEEEPTHMVTGVAVTVRTGLGLTVTTIVFEPVHPFAVPVTLYVVVITGLTDTGEPGRLPGVHK